MNPALLNGLLAVIDNNISSTLKNQTENINLQAKIVLENIMLLFFLSYL